MIWFRVTRINECLWECKIELGDDLKISNERLAFQGVSRIIVKKMPKQNESG